MNQPYPSNRVISYAYDEGAHLSGISGTTPGQSPRTYLSNLSYAAHGGLLSATMGNGAVETMSYNNRLQPTTISLTRNNSVLQRYDYQYGVVNPATGAVDASKNTGQVASIEGFIGADRQWQQRFSYDSIGRLSQAAEFTGDTLSLTYRSTYDYDRFGNRYQTAAHNPSNEALPYTPVEAQHINKQTNRYAVGFGLAYDAAGNVTADSKFRGLKYEYDANGRQWWSAPLSNPSNATVAVYDGVGQRVQMSADDVTTIMVYDIYGQLVAEYGGQASGGAGGVQYLMSDVQGSTRAVLNGDGVVTARHDYQAFGAEIGAGTGKRTGGQRYSATDSIRQRYAGMEQEGELSHTWFRQYESRSGRWTTPDPYGGSMSVGEPQSFNRYSYVHNDPVNRTDPSGLEDNMCFDEAGHPVNCDETIIIDTLEPRYPHDSTLDGFGAGWGWNGDDGFGSIRQDHLHNIDPPERLTSTQLDAIYNQIAGFLTDKCADFINQLVSSQTGKPYDVKNDLPGDFNRIRTGTDGFYFGGTPYGGEQRGSLASGNVAILINSGRDFRNPQIVAGAAATALHEILHAVTGAGDQLLSRQVKALGITVYAYPGHILAYPTDKDNSNLAYSGYWGAALKNACFPNL